MNKHTYDEEPVFYCLHCLSLRIRGIEDLEYCDECSSTDIGTANIMEWQEKYKEKYGKNYLN